MRFRVALAAATLALAALTGCSGLEPSGIERLYVLDCGQNLGKDQSRWSPGVNIGREIRFADNCYLIRHAKGWLLWDTGIPDAVAASPQGVSTGGGAIVQTRSKTLAAQLAELGLKPADLRYVAISHTHGDHVGNVDLFPSVPVLMQGAEFNWAFAEGKRPFTPKPNIQQLTGDHDVFGDGSVFILSTPGHTPGHQSLLVTLPKTGALILSGDAVHFMGNWEERRVPAMNTNREQTLASMQRIADLVQQRKAQLWINHDLPQSQAKRYSPAFYE
jgi:N-acyl homoserine lactone hydrolase